jgi:hypothetical protein|nr:MAG TPA: Lysozyme [Caudoviricetes sp.]
MANFKEAMGFLESLEFSKASDILHKNKNEKDITFYGIYKYAHPSWAGWDKVLKAIDKMGNLEKASVLLSKDSDLKELVYKFYKDEFWDKMRLDELISQKIADEMFIFGVNADYPPAIKLAQKIVGFSGKDIDGRVGVKTLQALNAYDPSKFDKEYDEGEKRYYTAIISANPQFRIYADGWRRRAEAV